MTKENALLRKKKDEKLNYFYDFEFYNRKTNEIEHNGTYRSVEEAFRNANGHIAVCTGSRPDNSIEVPNVFQFITKIYGRYIEDLDSEEKQALHNWAHSQKADYAGLDFQEILNVYNRTLGYNSWDDFYANDTENALIAWKESVRKN